MSLIMQRVRTHGWLRGIRYSLGVALLYPVLNERHKARLAEYQASKGGKVYTMVRVNPSNPHEGQARYSGTIADMVGQAEVSLEVVEALNAWNAEHTREGFRRGAMIEALHIVRCDLPEVFHGPYLPVEEVGT